MHDIKDTVDVSIGDGVVVLRRSSGSRTIVANVLGTEEVDGSPRVIYLDRIVHKPAEHQFVGWYVSGAVVTEMRRIPIQPETQKLSGGQHEHRTP